MGQTAREAEILAITSPGKPESGLFAQLGRGGFVSFQGIAVFPGSMPDKQGKVSSALWKKTATGITAIAQVGQAAPGTGGAVFATLPEITTISATGEVTFQATLQAGLGKPAVTAANDSGVWSELGGQGLRLLVRKGSAAPGLTDQKIAGFGAGVVAASPTQDGKADLVMPVILDKGGSALLRLSIGAEGVSGGTVLAQENAPVRDLQESFGPLNGSYTDPAHMDAQGNAVFAAVLKPGNRESLWYQPRDGAVQNIFMTGDVAPGVEGAAFVRLFKPSMGSDGILAFRAALNGEGKSRDGIWRGSVAQGFKPVLLCGDSGLPGMPTVAKVGNVWSGWLSAGNHGAWKAWLDVDGDGTSQSPKDVHAIYADTSGTMKLIVKQGDVAPDVSGAAITDFDSPVIGGQEQLAFLGKLTGPGITDQNNKGLWRQAANGSELSLVLRTGDTLKTIQGEKTVANLDLPGSSQKERRWEQPVMDATGRLLVLVQFTGGVSAQVLLP